MDRELVERLRLGGGSGGHAAGQPSDDGCYELYSVRAGMGVSSTLRNSTSDPSD
jgi:hypothetical protein